MSKRFSTSFGAARGTGSGPWPDAKGFLGKSADAGTRLTHIGAREYDPSMGQFISVDPVLQTDVSQTLNGYSYAAQNPVTGSDPTGLALRCGGPNDEACPDDGDPMPEPANHDGNGLTLGSPETSHDDGNGNYCGNACVQNIHLQQSRNSFEILGEVYQDILRFMFQEMATNSSGKDMSTMLSNENPKLCAALDIVSNNPVDRIEGMATVVADAVLGQSEDEAGHVAALAQFGWLVRSKGHGTTRGCCSRSSIWHPQVSGQT
ncbi:RHS repeat domain-containing protein [Streptomyces sp. NPDC002324]